MDYLVKLLFISGRFLTQVAGRTILQVYYKSVDIHQSLALKYYKVTQLAGNNENMLDLINSRVQEIGIHEGKLSACIGDDLYSDLNRCKTANSENLEAFINIDLTKYLGNKTKKLKNTVSSIENMSKNATCSLTSKNLLKHETNIAKQYASTPSLLKVSKKDVNVVEDSILGQVNKKKLVFATKHSSLSDISEKVKNSTSLNSKEFEICKLIVTKKVKKEKKGGENVRSTKSKAKPLEKLPAAGAVLAIEDLDDKKPILISDDEKVMFIDEDSKDLFKLIQNKIKVELEKHGFQDVVIPVENQKVKNRKTKFKKIDSSGDGSKLAKIKKQSETNMKTKKVLEKVTKSLPKMNEQLLSIKNIVKDRQTELCNNDKIHELAKHNKETPHLHHKSLKNNKRKSSESPVPKHNVANFKSKSFASMVDQTLEQVKNEMENYEIGTTNVAQIKKELDVIEKIYKGYLKIGQEKESSLLQTGKVSKEKLMEENQKAFQKLERKVTRKILNQFNKDQTTTKTDLKETQVLIPRCTKHELLKTVIEEDKNTRKNLMQVNMDAFDKFEKKKKLQN